MTERGSGSLGRGADWLRIGPSDLRWDGAVLTVRIDEIATPLFRRVRGTVRLVPSAIESRELTLDPGGRHRWRPIAPCARIEVAMEDPSLTWSGDAYFDTNNGDRALEEDFLNWNWSRASVAGGGTAVMYDIVGRMPDQSLNLAMRYDRRGGVEDVAPLPAAALPRTGWRIDRRIGVVPDHAPEVVATLEDTPFYARSIVWTHLAEGKVMAMHESLALDRFRSPWVQAMLPFRMPRRLGRG
jgi:carotenoid 1,2-hydratase